MRNVRIVFVRRVHSKSSRLFSLSRIFFSHLHSPVDSLAFCFFRLPFLIFSLVIHKGDYIFFCGFNVLLGFLEHGVQVQGCKYVKVIIK